MKINIPQDVQYILSTLHHKGYKSYVVGGCVRDSLLGRQPKDWDITTNATPDEVIELFDKTIPTGIEHGTITIMINNEGYEVTTFRTENGYGDKRRPNEVTFIDDLLEDLSRRDLTINAMAYNEQEGLIDPFDGQVDLINKVIKCVGSPNERFNEDALRMMRAVRFASQLGFGINNETFYSIMSNASGLKQVSMERVRDEFNKILLSDNPTSYLRALIVLDLFDVFMPEIGKMVGFNQNNPHHHLTLLNHTLESLNFTNKQLHLRLTMLLHDIGKLYTKTTDEQGVSHYYGHPKVSAKKSKEILKRLKYDNDTIDKVLTLIEHHDCVLESKKSVKRMMNKIGYEATSDLILVKQSDVFAQNPSEVESKIKLLTQASKIMIDIVHNQECFSLKDLNVNGRDLMELGIPQGKQIGQILNELLDIVIDDKELNDKDKLIAIVKTRYLCEQVR